ncbi:uncharacterized protein LOC121387563 [Gigantopelta aegis]|uniref:uncharacterized protein LOC121387563 n=1 Tax=Gigantopelta aegis TaxID=1735272 RepID=UPI001B887A00|nr:uncharacterized protein LOC121387563 [Gigantopelta aegis]
MEAAISKKSKNPEALLDVLAMQTLQRRQSSHAPASCSVTSDIDELVHSFTIDDSISECFASCEKIAKCAKTKKSVQKERETSGVVGVLRNYGKKSAWKNANSSLPSSVNSGSRKLLGGGVFQKKPKKPATPLNRTVQWSQDTLKMADNSSISVDTTTSKMPMKLDSATGSDVLYDDGSHATFGVFGAPQNKSTLSFDGTLETSPELFPLTESNVLPKKNEPTRAPCSTVVDYGTRDVTSKLSVQSSIATNEMMMNHLKQTIKLDNAKQLKLILYEMQPNGHVVSVNNWIELASMAARLGQHSCLLSLLECVSSATHVTPRDIQTITRAASVEAVRTDHVIILQSLVAEGFSIWEDEDQAVLKEARQCGSVGCYGYMLLLQVLALTFGKYTGKTSLNDVLKSVYKQCESSDCDVNEVVRNILKQNGGNVNESQVSKLQQRAIHQEEDPNNSRPQQLSGQSLATDSNKNAPETSLDSSDSCLARDLNKVLPAPANMLSKQDLATCLNDVLPKETERFSKQCVRKDVNKTFNDISSIGLTDQCSDTIKKCSNGNSSECAEVLKLSSTTNENLKDRHKLISKNQSTEKFEDCVHKLQRTVDQTHNNITDTCFSNATDKRHSHATGKIYIKRTDDNPVADKSTSSKHHCSVTGKPHSTRDDTETHSNAKLLVRFSEEDVDLIKAPSSTATECVVSNDGLMSGSNSVIAECDDLADSFSTSQSFPTISELDSTTTSCMTSYFSDGEEESSYYSEDGDDDDGGGGHYNAVVLNLKDEELDVDGLSQQRLLKHLESTRRQIYRNSDYVETVVTATGQRLSESGFLSDSPRTHEFRDSKDDVMKIGIDQCRYSKDDARKSGTDQCRDSKDDARKSGTDPYKYSKNYSKKSGTDQCRYFKDDATGHTFASLTSADVEQDADIVHRTRFSDADDIEWNCRPWYEVSDDDSLCLNRSNDSGSDDIMFW